MDIEQMKKELAELRAYKEAAENRSMAWIANALEQYTNGDVITVPAGAGTEEEFFAWLKDQGSAGAVPEDISAMIDKVRKWGVEHTGNEPSVSCFHRALDDLKAAIARPLPAAKPARITEQDARVLIESAMHHYIFNDRSTNIDVWFKEKGKVLLDKLNADRQGTAEQVPDAIQLLQRVSASTVDKPAVAVPDFETWWRSLPSYRDADKPAAKMAWDYLARLVTSPSHSQQSAVVVPDGFREIVESVAHIGVDFGYGNFALSQEHIEKARELLASAPSHSQQSAADPENKHAWIIENLSYHRFERDDLTLDECLSYLASEWKEVRGREVRPLVMQILALLAGERPAHDSEQGGAQ